MILYHVTTNKALEKILKSGFIKFGSSRIHGYRNDRVYLTDKEGVNVIVDGLICNVVVDDEDAEYPFELEAVVLKVDIPKSWIEKGSKEFYRKINPYAQEFWSFKQIPINKIRKIYKVECKRREKY